jgi:molybdopterin synthase catalytic subunit
VRVSRTTPLLSAAGRHRSNRRTHGDDMRPWNPNIRVQRDGFDLAEESRRLTEGRTDVGAVVAFTGYCRDEGETLAALELEHYPGMAEEEISRIAVEAAQRWSLLGLTVIHRVVVLLRLDPVALAAIRVVLVFPVRRAGFRIVQQLRRCVEGRLPMR